MQEGESGAESDDEGALNAVAADDQHTCFSVGRKATLVLTVATKGPDGRSSKVFQGFWESLAWETIRKEFKKVRRKNVESLEGDGEQPGCCSRFRWNSCHAVCALCSQ